LNGHSSVAELLECLVVRAITARPLRIQHDLDVDTGLLLFDDGRDQIDLGESKLFD
jgi:hypothetical protein